MNKEGDFDESKTEDMGDGAPLLGADHATHVRPSQSPGFKSTQGGFLYLPVKMTCGVSHSGKLQLEFSLSTDTVSTSFITCFAF